MSHPECLDILMVIAAFTSAFSSMMALLTAMMAWRTAKKVYRAEQLRLKASAFAEYRKHSSKGLTAVLFAFASSDGVIKALRNYTDAVKARKDDPISYEGPVIDIDGIPTCQLRSRWTVQTAVNRQQGEIDKLYEKVVEAMCSDAKVCYDGYLTITGFGSRDLESQYRNPL